MVELIYTDVKALDLTLDELRRCNIPDKYLGPLWVSFVSGSNKNYQAVHVPNGFPNPYILLSGKDKDEEDFKGVERIVAMITNGRFENKISDRGNWDICNIIDIQERLTFQRILEFIGEYGREFKRVKIPKMFLKNMPQFDYELSFLPKEKLTFESSYLNYPRLDFS